jgi:hypothetical protein
VPAGEAVARKELAATGTWQPQDVLKVRGRGGGGADGRWVEWAAREGEGEHRGHARAHLERHRVDVVVGDRVGDEVGHRPKHERAERRPGRHSGQSTGAYVQQDDHRLLPHREGYAPLPVRRTAPWHDSPPHPTAVTVDVGARARYASRGAGTANSKARQAMATDLSVALENRPGELAKLGEATGAAGVNIEGVCGVATGGGTATVHILVEDVAATRSALENAGLQVTDERDVLVVDVEDRPGTMGQVARKIADAGVNIELVYTTFGGVQLVLGVDDLEKARAAI